MLKIGDKAPEFMLNDKNLNKISLSKFLGKKVIIYFYPKDNTPGCTKEACDFRDNTQKFDENDIVIIGISSDSEKSHENFSARHNLPFILLADKEREVSKKYNVWKEKSIFSKIGLGIARTTFIIDKSGNIENIFENVKANKHIEEILQYLQI